jgi:hypothetical protein
VSAATGEGVDALLEAVWQQVAASRNPVATPPNDGSVPGPEPGLVSPEPPIRTLTE